MINYFKRIIQGLWTIVQGMRITIIYFFSKPVTMQYPDERWTLPERFRGMVQCATDKCIACLACANTCPVECITIESVKAEVPKSVLNIETGKEVKKVKEITKFRIDISRCLYCGLCTESCPTNAIQMSHQYETSCYNRKEMVYNWAKSPK